MRESWRVFITPAAERALKKLPNSVRYFVENKVPSLLKLNPFVGDQLSGPLSWLRSFHFAVSGKPYRVAYSVDAKSRKVIIHFVGYRGGFYERIRRLLG